MSHESLVDRLVATMKREGLLTTRGMIRHTRWTKSGALRGLEPNGRDNVICGVLEPFLPAGTLGWFVRPRGGERARAYAKRAVATAAARAAWAGGLLDGTYVPDDAALTAANWVARR